MENTIGRTNQTPMLHNEKMFVSNPIWIWQAASKPGEESSFTKLEFGRCLKDEMMDISFEPENQSDKHQRLYSKKENESAQNKINLLQSDRSH